MENYITLYNVVDTRTEQYHSIAIVKETNAKWFVQVDTADADEQNDNNQ